MRLEEELKQKISDIQKYMLYPSDEDILIKYIVKLMNLKRSGV